MFSNIFHGHHRIIERTDQVDPGAHAGDPPACRLWALARQRTGPAWLADQVSSQRDEDVADLETVNRTEWRRWPTLLSDATINHQNLRLSPSGTPNALDTDARGYMRRQHQQRFLPPLGKAAMSLTPLVNDSSVARISATLAANSPFLNKSIASASRL
jgi:hypothetical protein